MAKMLVSPKRLCRELVALRFSLRRSCTTTKEIDFSRPSTMPRIFESLRVCGQGKLGEAVYATTSVSASPNWLNDDCISIVDHSLMFALEADPERHWTILSSSDDAKLWESRLIQLADKACLKTTNEYGRSLEKRLANEFATFDRYVEELGDMRSIFDSEFRFMADAGGREQSLANLWSIGKGEDWRLACHLLLRYSSKLSQQPISDSNSRLHDSAPLRALLYLMTDHVAACRAQYGVMNRK